MFDLHLIQCQRQQQKTTPASKTVTELAIAAQSGNSTPWKTGTWSLIIYWSITVSVECKCNLASNGLPSWIEAICNNASSQVATAAKYSIIRAFQSMEQPPRMEAFFSLRLVEHVVGLLQTIGRASSIKNNCNNNNSHGRFQLQQQSKAA